MISLTDNGNGQTMELTRIILPASSGIPSVDRQDHLAAGSNISTLPVTTIWKSKNTMILNYETSGQKYFEFIEISPQIGTPIVKNTTRFTSPARASNQY
jgi:hypothetical protein